MPEMVATVVMSRWRLWLFKTCSWIAVPFLYLMVCAGILDRDKAIDAITDVVAPWLARGATFKFR